MDTPADPWAALARQLRLHLESYKAAGVEFIPVAAPIAFAAPAPVLQSEQGADAPRSPEPIVATPDMAGLFDEPEAPLPDTPDGRRHELAVLAERVAGCPRCPQLYSTRTQTVFGTGPIDPEICF